MNLTKRQIEFWGFLIALGIIIAVAVLFVDFGIKAAILEESNRLRQVIEAEEVRRSGRRNETSDDLGNHNDATDDPAISGNVLVDDPAGMETANGHSGDKVTVRPARARSRTKPS